MAMMDTKMAQFRIEPLTEALPESIRSCDLALQIWGFFSTLPNISHKKAPTFTSRDFEKLKLNLWSFHTTPLEE